MVLLEVMTGDKVRPASSLADGLLKAVDPKTGSPSASSLGLALPKAVEELLLRAVAQDPTARPRDAGVFWSELKAAIAASPKPNLAAATVMDDSMNVAMQEVRDAAVRASMQPAPFTGTMLMQNAPQGAPHLVAHPATVSTSTAPLAAPVPSPGLGNAAPGSVPPPPGPDSVAEARRRGEQLKGTLPIGAVSPMAGMSPLAASTAMPSPLANASRPPPPQQQQQQARPQQQQQQQQPQQAHQAPHQLPQHPPPAADPRMKSGAPGPLPVKSNAGAIIFVVLCVMLAVAGAAFYWVRTH